MISCRADLFKSLKPLPPDVAVEMRVDVFQSEMNGQPSYTPLFGFKRINDQNIAADIRAILRREEECSKLHLAPSWYCIDDEGWLAKPAASTTYEAGWEEVNRIVDRINKIKGVKATSLRQHILEVMK